MMVNSNNCDYCDAQSAKKSVMEYNVIKEALLINKAPTGKTKHYDVDGLITAITKLQVVQYAEDPGYYLFYLGVDDVVLTDTYHDTVDKAAHQAAWEYELLDSDWVDIS